MARRRTPPATPPPRLILDSGAVIALSRGDARARAFLHRAVTMGAEVSIPAVVIAETVRGKARDATVNRVIGAVDSVVPLDEPIGRAAGALLGASGMNQAIDAAVVAIAAAGGGHILTSDSDDLSRLASYAKGVWIHST